jgi:AmpD protein
MPFLDDSREQVNDFSIGIEVVTSGHEGDFTTSQYDALIELIRGIRARHPITAIVGHEHIAPGRKTDPGPQFDWQRIAAAVREWVSRDPTQSSYTPIRFSWEERVGKE